MKPKNISLRPIIIVQFIFILFLLQNLTGCSDGNDSGWCNGNNPGCNCGNDPANSPVAHAGENTTYYLGVGEINYLVSLDGSASTDADGNIVSYVWSGTPDPSDVERPVVSLPFGSHTFTLVVTNGHGLESDPASVTITVEAPVTPSEHHAPEILLDTLVYTVAEGNAMEISVSASDPDGDPVSLSASTKISNAAFAAVSGNQATGVFSFTPTYNQQGFHAVVFSAMDTFGNKSSKIATIRVDNVNRAPTLSISGAAAVDEGGLLTVKLTATDPDNDILTYSASAMPDNAVMVPSAGSLTFMPDYDQSGTYDIPCAVTDGQYTDTRTLTVTVNDVPTGGTGQPRELVLTINEPESPSFLSTVNISGSVNPGSGAPAARGRQSTLIVGLSPSTGKQGQTLDVTLTGETTGDYATQFTQGISQAVFADNITVNSLTVNSAWEAVANITVNPDAKKGPRLVTIATDNKTAVSVVAFNVTTGTTTLTGTLLSDTGAPVPNAVISVQGTLIQAQSRADGTFILLDVPANAQTLIINAPNHELTYLDVSSYGGTEVALEDVEIPSTVFDPTADPSATIHSLLNRGIGDITGNVTVEEAARMIVDTIICVGGNEAGVLDAYGNQLNPAVEGLGKTSFTDSGVKQYAQRMAMGQSTTLMELFMEISFSFTWDPGPPTFKQLLNGMQEIVNQAWNDSGNPSFRIPILLFNRGDALSPNPPTLDANTRISIFQAYLAVNSFMTTIYNHRDEWGNVTGLNTNSKDNTLAEIMNTGLYQMLSPKTAWAEDPPGVYTITWENLLADFPATPSGTGASTGSPTAITLPDFENLLKKYYLDMTEDSLTGAKDLLIATFPTYFSTEKINELFEDNPYNLKKALEQLILIGSQEQDIADLMGQIMSRDGKNTPGQTNLWHFWDMEKGSTQNLFYGEGYLPSYFPPGMLAFPNMIVQALPVGSPYIFSSSDATTLLTTPDGDLSIPAAKILFYPSGDDALSENPLDMTFVYRLWRIDKGTKKTTDSTGAETTQKYDLTLAAYGQLDEDKTLAPTAEKNSAGNPTGKYIFMVPLPPPGMNAYKIDCIRFNGDKSLVSAIDPLEFENRLTPWLAGYLDEPLTWQPSAGLSNTQVHPARGVLRNLRYDISTLSKSSSVYISGAAAGFTTFARIDLAADYENNEKIYLSIPSYKTDAHGDRGTGSIFRYDGKTRELSEYTRPGFIQPGQIGLAIDGYSNLYSENAATEASYGGKLFRYLGYRNTTDPPFEPAYAPPYPNPDHSDPAAAAAGEPPHRLFVGTVNYYSSLIQRANPVGLMGMVMGNASSRELGEELYVADGLGSGAGIASGGLASQIKKIPVQAPEQYNYPSYHNPSELWAWNDKSETGTSLLDQDYLNFGYLTDLAFDRTKSKMFITQGTYVVQTAGGKNASFSITKNGTLFTSASGCAVCESNGDQILFVADRAENRILRIPLKDLNQPVPGFPDLFQLEVPADEAEKKQQINGYTFYQDLDKPGQLRITDNGNALVVVDNAGIKYIPFGITGQAINVDGEILIGAVVTIKTLAGEQSTTTDSNGIFNFTGVSEYATIADISHPDRSYSERITVTGKCNFTGKPRPCVVITEPANGTFTHSGTTTVKGTVFPDTVDFTVSGGELEVVTPSGSYFHELEFTGDKNDFIVSNISLGVGTNYLIARTYGVGAFDAGASLYSSVTQTAAVITTQSYSGVAVNAEGVPLGDVAVEIYVDGTLVDVVETDACGYYNAQSLPLGTVTVNVIE